MSAGTDNSDHPAGGGDTGGESIGARLRAARDRRNLSPEQVASELHLDLDVVRAIEANDQSVLPEPIFVQGYLRNYARLVGLPEEEIMQQYHGEVHEPPPLHTIGPDRKLPLFQLPSVKYIRNTILIMLVVILGWLAYPYVERLLEIRGSDSEEQVPGQLELPPAFDSE